jgi:hypothetical protein
VADLWDAEGKGDEWAGMLIGAGFEDEDGEFGRELEEAGGEHAASDAIASDVVVCILFGHFDGIEAGESEDD